MFYTNEAGSILASFGPGVMIAIGVLLKITKDTLQKLLVLSLIGRSKAVRNEKPAYRINKLSEADARKKYKMPDKDVVKSRMKDLKVANELLHKHYTKILPEFKNVYGKEYLDLVTIVDANTEEFNEFTDLKTGNVYCVLTKIGTFAHDKALLVNQHMTKVTDIDSVSYGINRDLSALTDFFTTISMRVNDDLKYNGINLDEVYCAPCNMLSETHDIGSAKDADNKYGCYCGCAIVTAISLEPKK